MSDVAFLDDWLDDDERAALDGWADVVSGMDAPAPEPDRLPSTSDMLALYRFVSEQGWLDLLLQPDVPAVLGLEAVKRLHRRVVPVPLPLVEIWSAGRLLPALDTAAAQKLALALGDGTGCVVLSVDDLFGSFSGTTGWVPFGGSVTFLLPVVSSAGEATVYLVPAEVGSVVHANNPDPTLPAARLSLSLDGLEVLGVLSPSAVVSVRAHVLVAQASALAGQAQGLLSSTLEFLRTRHQFGVPIGSFQALKHRCADLAADLHAANLASAHAASRLDDPDAEALALLAKALCGRSALTTASESVQLHGGMGFTWEGGVHFGLKRVAYLAGTGLTVGACEEALGAWAAGRESLPWAGRI